MELVPVSYAIPKERISVIGKHPVASGGFGDVWKGTYDERSVAIKALRIYKNDDMRKVRRVGHSGMAIHEFCRLSAFSLGLLQGDYRVETAVTPQHRAIPWSYRRPRPTLYGVGVDAER